MECNEKCLCLECTLRRLEMVCGNGANDMFSLWGRGGQFADLGTVGQAE